ncbi:MAG: hypothetical protein J2P35_24570, partial [Actinobacteria bacterium]|nr:hypothetical protein [Actinomycetota bacterium]
MSAASQEPAAGSGGDTPMTRAPDVPVAETGDVPVAETGDVPVAGAPDVPVIETVDVTKHFSVGHGGPGRG